MPDTRILHINLAVKKKGIPLFIQSRDDPLVWTTNKSPDSISFKSKPLLYVDEEKIEADHNEPQSFEDCVVYVLKQHPHGIHINDLIEETRQYSEKEGMFVKLAHPRRVKAVLVSKRMTSEVFESYGVWSYQCHIAAADLPVKKTPDSSTVRRFLIILFSD